MFNFVSIDKAIKTNQFKCKKNGLVKMKHQFIKMYNPAENGENVHL